ncbi:MAG: vitamin K epoxide reductase family protein [Fimbriimonadaceae bacterium]|nr:vitamin K epoxide reductase family protein [Fimbriimonadaceae bacterium]
MSQTLLNRILMLLAFAGIFVAGVLSLGHVLNASVPCGVNSHGCETVAMHPTSKWFGVPVAFVGLAGYAFFAVLALLRILRPDNGPRLGGLGLAASGVGTLVSLWLSYVALTEIKATCPWCLSSAAIMSLTFVVYAIAMQRYARGADEVPAESKFDRYAFLALLIVALGGVGVEAGGMRDKAGKTGLSSAALEKLDLSLIAPQTAPEDGKTSLHVAGNADAPVTIVEFADIFCPHCRDHYAETKDLAVKSDGKVRLVYRHFPLFNTEGHELSLPAAIIAEWCGRQGKFWDYMDVVMQAETEQVKSDEGLLKVVEMIGLDRTEARKIAGQAEGAAFDLVYRDIELGNLAGIQSTPTYLVFAPGQKPEAATPLTLKEIVDRKVAALKNGS